MIISAGDGHHFADPDSRYSFRRHRLVFRWIADGTGSDNDALSGHEPRVGSGCSDRSGIGQADCCSLKIRNLKLAAASSSDNVIVRRKQLGKAELVGAFYVWDEQGPSPVFL